MYNFCSELKRRLKAEQKAKEKIEKAAAQAQVQTQAKPIAGKDVNPLDGEISPNVSIHIFGLASFFKFEDKMNSFFRNILNYGRPVLPS